MKTKHLFWVALVAVAAATAPLLALAYYNYPMVDDFFFARAPRQAYIETGSLFSVIVAAAKYTARRFMTWQGLYSGVFVCSLQPMVFGERAQVAGPYIMLVALAGGVLFLCCAALKKAAGATLWEGLFTGLILFFCLTQFVPSPNEAFYWYTGAVFYTLVFAAMLALFATLFLLCFAKTRKSRVAALVASLLLAAIMGGSGFMSGLQSVMVLCLFVVLLLAAKNPLWKWTLAPALVCAAGFAVSLAAPGNALRIDTATDTRSFVSTILLSLWQTPGYLVRSLAFPVFVFLLLLAPVFWRAAGRMACRFRLPGLVLAVAYGFLAAGLCPILYTAPDVLPKRYRNWMFFTCVLAVAVCLFYLIGWLRKTLDRLRDSGRTGLPDGNAVEGFLRKYAVVGLAGVVAVLAGGVLLWPGGAEAGLTEYAGIEALQTIRSGDALAYKQQMDQRNAVLHAAQPGSDVQVPALDVEPKMLFRQDGHLSWDTDSWLNSMIADYYGVATLVPAELWDITLAEIQAAPEGGTVNVAVAHRDFLPAALVDALRGRDVTLALASPLGEYRMNGLDLVGTEAGLYYSFGDLRALGCMTLEPW